MEIETIGYRNNGIKRGDFYTLTNSINKVLNTMINGVDGKPLSAEEFEKQYMALDSFINDLLTKSNGFIDCDNIEIAKSFDSVFESVSTIRRAIRNLARSTEMLSGPFITEEDKKSAETRYIISKKILDSAYKNALEKTGNAVKLLTNNNGRSM